MKTITAATAALALMFGSAFAQTSTGPAPQSDSMNKPGTSNGMDKGSMEKGSMDKSTTGMNSGSSTGGASAPTTPSGGSSMQGGQGKAGVAGGK
ncbi:hypothetical protein [Bradyrhizobium sp. LTSP857]|uniref:hypothetical protein n=1 Tax=Bradyrhizobium sp. LTSP857 TaxID=1619231 RepID=UPI0005D2B8CC|nr:hypothetical protein [Bradyrhizobium sp. LTSP857]KJC44545.1 hypothetical protein UP06_18965 [Bradyrhizobium sp. LTSP857]